MQPDESVFITDLGERKLLFISGGFSFATMLKKNNVASSTEDNIFEDDKGNYIELSPNDDNVFSEEIKKLDYVAKTTYVSASPPFVMNIFSPLRM